ncbi:MAG: DUF1896 domain-containing protein [Prolixibacteraceae bacterium]|nr:DUF1896 domain-containing protein [Prolixibacteraceae bacterium]
MKMFDELNTADVFQNRIFKYILDYHPYLLEDREVAKEIIITRANLARESYKKASLDGKPHYMAMEEANTILHAGLEFSPISFLQEIYKSATHGEDLDDKKAVEIYKKTKDIFEKFGNDVEGTDQEDLLVNELIPFLNLKL